MDDFLDLELEKSTDEIDVDKIESYLEKYLKDKNISELTRKEEYRSFNILKKNCLRRQKNENRALVKRVLIPITTVIIVLVLGTTVFAYASGINIFEEFISLFKSDEYTIVDDDDIYIIDDETKEHGINESKSLKELLAIEPNMEYLKNFENYINSINVSETELSKIYTVSIKYNDRDVIIRAYLYNDEELTDLMFNEIIADTPDTFEISNIIYYYNVDMINFIADENIIYTIYNMDFEDLKKIVK